MNVYAIDFETDYDKEYSIKTIGSYCYIHDPRFNAYMVSVVGDDGLEWVGHPADFDWDSIAGHEWVSHNASFDELVYRRLFRDLGLTAIPANWYCTSNLSSYLQAPRSLAGASKQLLGKFVDKGVRAKQSGRDQTAVTEEDAAELREYALDDSRLCLAIWQKYGHLMPPEERLLGRLTYLWGAQGVQLDRRKVLGDVISLTNRANSALRKLPWVNEGSGKALSRSALLRQCVAEGIEQPVSLAMDSPHAQRWEAKYSADYDWVDAVREYRRTNRLLKVCETLKDRVDGDDMFHYAMKYYAAMPTGRWGGSDGLNMQNLPRGEMFGVDVRKSFIPRPGHVFIIADLSQIEVRTLAHLAGQEDYLQMIREGLNPYEAAAQIMLGMEDAHGLKDRDSAMYAMVKAMVLGCGYGMQGATFQKSAPALTDGKYNPTRQEADKAVLTYRQKNPEVPRLWNAMGKELRDSACKAEDFDLILPSGRRLWYGSPQIKGNTYTAIVQKGGPRKYFFGAKVVENASQGYARDVFAHALLRIEAAHLPGRIVWHVHDEVIFEAPKINAVQIAAEIHRLMCIPPSWAPNLPIAAECHVVERYCK